MKPQSFLSPRAWLLVACALLLICVLAPMLNLWVPEGHPLAAPVK